MIFKVLVRVSVFFFFCMNWFYSFYSYICCASCLLSWYTTDTYQFIIIFLKLLLLEFIFTVCRTLNRRTSLSHLSITIYVLFASCKKTTLSLSIIYYCWGKVLLPRLEFISLLIFSLLLLFFYYFQLQCTYKT